MTMSVYSCFAVNVDEFVLLTCVVRTVLLCGDVKSHPRSFKLPDHICVRVCVCVHVDLYDLCCGDINMLT